MHDLLAVRSTFPDRSWWLASIPVSRTATVIPSRLVLQVDGAVHRARIHGDEHVPIGGYQLHGLAGYY